MPTAIEQIFPASPSTGRLQPALAAPWVFTGEDNLRVVILNALPGVVVRLDGRMLGEGEQSPNVFSYTFTPAATRLPQTFEIIFGVGFLLNLSIVVVAGTPTIGQTYVMVQVTRGVGPAADLVGCLIGDYVTAMQHVAYPGSPIASSIDGPGAIRTIVGTTPAPSAEVLETVPAGARWELLTFRGLFVPGGVFGARTPMLYGATPVNNVFIVPQSANVNAPNGMWACWSNGLGVNPPMVGTYASQSLPVSVPLLAGSVVGTLTDALAAGDQWSIISYTVREWLEGA